jgi:hypothetical protein
MTGVYQPFKKEVTEIFGYPSHTTDANAMQNRSRYLCPFQKEKTGRLRVCNKLSQHTLFEKLHQSGVPFGACSVWHKTRKQKEYYPHIICPARFLQSNAIFNDAKSVLRDWRSSSHYIVIREVNLALGRLDYVLVNYDTKSAEIVDTCIMEVMAVSTTTTGDIIRSMFECLGVTGAAQTTYKYGINYRQVVSRMLIQLIAKSHAADVWGARMVWVIQDVLYDYMQRTTKLELQDITVPELDNSPSDIFFFVYSLETNPYHQPYNLKLNKIKGGKLADMKRILEPKEIPSLAMWTQWIQNSIRERGPNFFDLTENADVTPLQPFVEEEDEEE